MHRERAWARSPTAPARPAPQEPVRGPAELVLGAGGNRAAVLLARAMLARRAPVRPKPEPGPNDLVATARTLVADWDALAEPMARAQRLGDAVNRLLRAGDKPPVDLSFDPPPDAGPLESLGGHFASKTWTLHVDGTVYQSPTPPNEEELITATATITHEARHVHQWYSMARYIAGGPDKPTVSEIASAVEVPTHVARRARHHPLREGQPEYTKAKRWYEEVFGDGRERRAEILRSLMSAQVELRLAQVELDQATTPDGRKAAKARLAAAQREYARWYKRCMQLATEADAARAEEVIRRAFAANDAQTPTPPAAEGE